MAIERDSPSVQTYLTMLQGVIGRMAANSASCKTWCVTLVAAIAALGINAKQYGLIFLALLPVAAFFLLDSYYLSLERDFRRMYDNFVERVHANEAADTEVFQLQPPSGWKHRGLSAARALTSPSLLPFYVVLALAVVVTHLIAAA